jgi:hypothetical protein
MQQSQKWLDRKGNWWLPMTIRRNSSCERSK